jgi:hypothetical protein
VQLEELPAEEGAGLWPQPIHVKVSGGRPHGGTASGTASGVEQVAARR